MIVIELFTVVFIVGFTALIFFLLGMVMGSLTQFKSDQELLLKQEKKKKQKCPKCKNPIESHTDYESKLYEYKNCTECDWNERKEVKD